MQGCIRDMINSGKPFLIGRMGGTESAVALCAERKRTGLSRHIPDKWREKLCIGAGFFPNDETSMMDFSGLIIDCLRQSDVLGFMPMQRGAEFLIRNYLNPSAALTFIDSLEPYYFPNPWTKALEGKKVLVIHPFEESILRQYEKRQYLFENKDILPEFKLRTVKAVQSIAGEKTQFNNWFEALEHMYEQAMCEEFDIAIIGCGAYGFPLAAKIKKAGKQAIHLGGATQILFGIKGSRWNAVPDVAKLFNEYWTVPLESETPLNAKKVENACYW